MQPGNEFVKVLNSIVNRKYFNLNEKIKDGEFEIPLEEKEKEDGKSAVS